MNKTISKSAAFVIFILFIVSMQHWIGWYYRQQISILGGFLLIFLHRINGTQICLSYRNVLSCIILYFGLLIGSIGWRGDLLSQAVYTQIISFGIPIASMMCLNGRDEILLFKYITKWFAWMMIPAIILYILTSFITLPYFGETKWIDPDMAKNGYGCNYNYLFYLKPINTLSDYSIERFQGPFLEPGHLGMICAFILFANQHDYSKKENKVILVSLLLSFSLAGWVLCAIGYLFIRYYQEKIHLSKVLVMIVLVAAFIGFAKTYNDGKNVLNEAVVSRLESDDEKGIAGNNRSSMYTQVLFFKMWSTPSTLVWGYDKEYIEQLNTSWATKVTGSGIVKYIVENGLFGLFFAWAFYIYYAMSSKNRKFGWLAILFFVILFMQRCYFMWYSWIICYFAAIERADYQLIFKKRTNGKSFS